MPTMVVRTADCSTEHLDETARDIAVADQQRARTSNRSLAGDSDPIRNPQSATPSNG